MTPEHNRLSASSRPDSCGPASRPSGTFGGIDQPTRRRAQAALLDLGLAILAIAPLAIGAGEGRGDLSALVTGLSIAVALVLIPLRRYQPWPALVLSVAAAVWTMALASGPTPMVLIVFILLFNIAVRTNRATAVVTGASVAAVLFTTSYLVTSNGLLDPLNVQMVAWSGLAAAAGDAVRNRRDYRTATEARIERAERAVEEESRRRVVEERILIARELHDVVAHHIAVVNVQAGVAAHLVRTDPDGAEAALVEVRRGGRSVLDEMSVILSVLRDTDDNLAPPTVEPLPGLERLDALTQSFDAAGLTIEWHVSGRPPDLPATLSLTAYRIVEEALTNVYKHGGGAGAKVTLCYEPDALDIEVLNLGGRPTTQAASHSGHGTTGMRERVAAVGGTIERGPNREGVFRVHTHLPIPTEES